MKSESKIAWLLFLAWPRAVVLVLKSPAYVIDNGFAVAFRISFWAVTGPTRVLNNLFFLSFKHAIFVNRLHLHALCNALIARRRNVFVLICSALRAKHDYWIPRVFILPAYTDRQSELKFTFFESFRFIVSTAKWYLMRSLLRLPREDDSELTNQQILRFRLPHLSHSTNSVIASSKYNKWHVYCYCPNPPALVAGLL